MAPPRADPRRRPHTFEELAEAIEIALDAGTALTFKSSPSPRLSLPDPDWEIEGEATEDYRRVRLSRLRPGEQFVYVFDLGDDWAHLCTMGPERVDPLTTLGIIPDKPLPYWGWGDLPDQYGRRWDGDHGESRPPKDPKVADLPRLRPDWGPETHLTRP